MVDFLKDGLEGNDMEELNRCRLFLKATCLSDISTGDEKCIREQHGMESKIPLASGMNGVHSTNLTKIYG